jgi:hypothetical protein
MKRTVIIGLGGLAAMVGAVAYATLSLAVWLSEPPFSRSIPYLDSASDLTIQTLVNVSDVFLAVGALAAIVALHALHRESYGMMGTLVFVVAFVGAALLLVVGLGYVLPLFLFWSSTPLNWGLMLAALGGMGLGVVTIAARALPWWCGVALIVGSLGFAPASLYGELWGVLVGVAWTLVGYAVLRAAGTHRSEQPSRVR